MLVKRVCLVPCENEGVSGIGVVLGKGVKMSSGQGGRNRGVSVGGNVQAVHSVCLSSTFHLGRQVVVVRRCVMVVGTGKRSPVPAVNVSGPYGGSAVVVRP